MELQKLFNSAIIVVSNLKMEECILISIIIQAIEDDHQRKFMENIYKLYYVEMKKKALSIVDNETEAEEIVQESFVKLIKRVDTLINIDTNKLPAYLMATVKNSAINFIKHKSYESSFIVYSDEDDVVERLPDEEGIPERILSHKEDLEILARALPLLPERDLRLLEAKYILDLTNEEISKQFNIAPGSVRTYIMRARKRAYLLFLKEEKVDA